MSTDTTATGRTLVHPTTGEVLDLAGATTTELAAGLVELDELLSELGAFRQAAVDEVARRMDRVNTRTERVGEWELETNAPTTETYAVDVLRERLAPLVEAGTIDQELVDRLVTTPAPKPPEPRVDKRELNKLKRTTDRDVLAAIAAARTINPQRRNLKLRRIG